MNDKLDFDLLEKCAEKSPLDLSGKNFHYYWVFQENGVETKVSGNKRKGFSMWQTPPPPAFFKIYKEYYPNGYLQLKGKCMGGGATMVGEWEYYDDTGTITSIKNEDEKFGKFGYNELLLLLHQQEHINIKTGENRESVSFGYDAETKQWGVSIEGFGLWYTVYIIDGETGEVINKRVYQKKI